MGGTPLRFYDYIIHIKLEISSHFSAVRTQLSFISIITAFHNCFSPRWQAQPRGPTPFPFLLWVNFSLMSVYLIFPSHVYIFHSLNNVFWRSRRTESTGDLFLFMKVCFSWSQGRFILWSLVDFVWVVCSGSHQTRAPHSNNSPLFGFSWSPEGCVSVIPHLEDSKADVFFFFFSFVDIFKEMNAGL